MKVQKEAEKANPNCEACKGRGRRNYQNPYAYSRGNGFNRNSVISGPCNVCRPNAHKKWKEEPL